MKKILNKILIVLFFCVIYTYILCINNIPNELILYENEEFCFKKIWGIEISEDIDTINTAVVDDKKTINNKEKLKVSLFNKVPIKEIDVEVIKNTKIIPNGNIAGLKLYTNGVLVVGMSEIEGIDQRTYKPYENSGIKEGDRILKINNKAIINTKDLIQKVNNSNGKEIDIEYARDEIIKECYINPIKTGKDEYKIGLWVRDSAAGVGTVTFYEPETRKFAALGHGIVDIDTEQLINISSGEFVTTRIIDIIKGKSGQPGKIQGTIENSKRIGEIYKNTNFGVFGKANDLNLLKTNLNSEIEVASRNEINLGKAEIICNLSNNKEERYEIEIEKIYRENNYNNKSMRIKVTDNRLIEKTGGIIQGMSGSPIIQNNKFVGAVTSVLVKNPEEGYAIFGDLMIKELRKIK